MTLRQRRKLLWLAAAICVVGAVGVAVAGVLWPVEIEAGDVAVNARPTVPVAVDRSVPLTRLAEAALRSVEVPAAPTVAVDTPAATPELTLVGTVGDSVALVRDGRGVQVVHVGERLGGAVLERVANGSAEFVEGERRFTLNRPDPEPAALLREAGSTAP